MTETVTVLRGTPVADPYGGTDTGLSWDDPARTDVEATALEPRPSSEPTQDARNSVTTGYTVYLTGQPDVTAQDRVEIRGETYQVDGAPADWRSPFSSWQPGLIVQTTQVAG